MLHIKYENKEEDCWKVGNTFSEITPNLVSELYADGEELRLIRALFKSISSNSYKFIYIHDHSSVYWFGNVAKFIAKSLQEVS